VSVIVRPNDAFLPTFPMTVESVGWPEVDTISSKLLPLVKGVAGASAPVIPGLPV